ncbi:argininosuccinate lyase [Burkholderia sp. Bp8998]|uniref:argininosuccinate lyase n=1 Tax=Burkholderia sp. Bp8998 TaxID=2184557 RepID=UPI000F5B50F6|nr:argininosuccinate lyase [Burkholderia sp. Bp8998]RQS21339.1 argininosuccinate lyase [Burkholderia sp. Bp8998]
MKTQDSSRFPAPVYTKTVLSPLFEGAKQHHRNFQRVDRAHLVMLMETGVVDRDTASSIGRALQDIERELDIDALKYTGEVEDFFFLIEGELKKRLGVDIAGRLHTARSRNDMDHTLFKLAMKPRIDELLAKARSLVRSLLATARREKATLIVAYTHGQPAQPTTFGHYLGAAIEVLLRDIDRLQGVRELVDLCPMGAAAITTTGFPIDRHRVAELLGFSAPLRNSYSCIAAADYVTSTYSAIELMMLHLGRLVQDFQFWSSFEVGQLYVPNAFVQISSIMPQKRNPVPIEHLRLLASHAMTRSHAMLTVMHNTPFTDMNDSEGETHTQGHTAFDLAGRVLDLLAGFVQVLTVNEDKVRANIGKSCITVTELADTLVRVEGLSFRQAHEIAAHTAKAVVSIESGLAERGYLFFQDVFARTCGRVPGIDEQAFREIVSPEHFIAVRDRFGGPAATSLDAAFDAYADRLTEFDDIAAATAERERNAIAKLRSSFANLVEG